MCNRAVHDEWSFGPSHDFSLRENFDGCLGSSHIPNTRSPHAGHKASFQATHQLTYATYLGYDSLSIGTRQHFVLPRPLDSKWGPITLRASLSNTTPPLRSGKLLAGVLACTARIHPA